MRNENLYRRGTELIPAVAYGDAAGLPVETKTAAYIAERFGKIGQLIPTLENDYFQFNEWPGNWSDDTQLTLAVAQSLIQANGFDMDALVETHMDAYFQTPDIELHGKRTKQGWGGSTIQAIERIIMGADAAESGTINGAGNGVLMKMAPLAYWQTVRGISGEEAVEQYDTLTTMTHDSDIARLTTRVHGDVLSYLMTEGYDPESFVAMLRSSVAHHEFETKQFGELRSAFSYLHKPVTTERILNHTDEKGFYAPQTLAMAYGTFMKHYGDFRTSVYEAVNLGGDTDSTASIVASMSVLNSQEPVRMPLDAKELDQLAHLKTVSSKLAQTAFIQ